MTYTEWRDELKSNLLSVSESERRRVLDYYAEAYADRREAGFTEREIIEDFGAPYDAAKRILAENGEDPVDATAKDTAKDSVNDTANTPPPPPPAPAVTPLPVRENYTWLFVLLCVIFCVPLFLFIMALAGITVGLCAFPIIIIGSGAAVAGGALGTMIGGDIYYGLYQLGGGIITLGVGVILCPSCFHLVKLMWTLFKKVFCWIKGIFSGKAGYAQ